MCGFKDTQNPMPVKTLERRSLIIICTLFLVVHCLSGLSTRAAEESTAKPMIEMLTWLAGNWFLERGGRTVTEQWMAPAGGTMLGMSRTVAKGKTIEFEFLLLRQDDEGNIAYVAKPSGQSETTFKLVRASATEVIFENPQHDFPQRISYTLKSDDTMLAAIEGTKDGKYRRIEFPYQRAKPDKNSRADGPSAISPAARREFERVRPVPPCWWTTAVQPVTGREPSRT